jgi:large subunit ribosomal protein L24
MQKTERVKNPRKQRKTLFNAPAHIRHKLMAAPLSKELTASRGAKTLPVRKGDTVRIERGDNKGFEGKVSRVDLKAYRIYIEGLTREKVDGTNIFIAVHPSKVQIRNLSLDDNWRKNILSRKKEMAKAEEKAKPKAKPAKKPAKAPAKPKAEVEEEKPVKAPPIEEEAAHEVVKEEAPAEKAQKLEAEEVALEKAPAPKKALAKKTSAKKPAVKKEKGLAVEEEKAPAAKKAAAKKAPATKEAEAKPRAKRKTPKGKGGQ